MDAADDLRIEHVANDGTLTVLKASVPVQEGEIVDGTFMSKRALTEFLAAQIERRATTRVCCSPSTSRRR